MTAYDWELIFTWLFYGGFIGFGCGIIVSKVSFGRIIKDKADTNIRLESGGKLYTIHSVGKPTMPAQMGKQSEQHEPVAWMVYTRDGQSVYVTDNPTDIQVGQQALPLYTTAQIAPARTWVGLTDENIKEIIGPYGDTPIKGYTRKLFDQIESKLKEKNT